MFEKEREMVELGPHSYNLKEGGEGGWDSQQQSSYRILADFALQKKYGDDWRKIIAFLGSKKGNEINKKRGTGVYNPVIRQLGHLASLSDSSKEKRRHSFEKIQHQQGEKNSQFGTMWITNGIESKKIKKDDLIPEGWKKGRKQLKDIRL
jgi:hypothetical protein